MIRHADFAMVSGAFLLAMAASLAAAAALDNGVGQLPMMGWTVRPPSARACCQPFC